MTRTDSMPLKILVWVKLFPAFIGGWILYTLIPQQSVSCLWPVN